MRSNSAAAALSNSAQVQIPGNAPYTCDTMYRTPQPSTPTEQTLYAAVSAGELEETRSCLQGAASRTEMVRAGALDIAILKGRTDILKVMLSFSCLDLAYCGPMNAVAKLGDASLVPLLAADPRIDINTGCPLRAAVECGNHAVIEAFLQQPRATPNRGFPLFYAVRRGDENAVKLLLSHPDTFVNKMTPGVGTNPLGASIMAGNESIFALLLTHPRIDVNRGFTMTPLQMAASLGRSHFVRSLLSRPTLSVNKTLGPESTPLELAIENDHNDVVGALLRDSRTFVPLRLIDRLEETNNVAVLQQLTDATEYRMGTLWNVRCLLCPFVTLLMLLSGVFDLRFLSVAFVEDIMIAVCFAVVRLAAGIPVLASLQRQQMTTPVFKALVLVPFFPVFEFLSTGLLFKALSAKHPDLFRREKCFLAVQRASAAKVVLLEAPLLTVLVLGCCIALILGGDLSQLVPSMLMCLIFHLFCAGAMYGMRRDRLKPTQASREYVSLEVL